jgi:hypothetical protein
VTGRIRDIRINKARRAQREVCLFGGHIIALQKGGAWVCLTCGGAL